MPHRPQFTPLDTEKGWKIEIPRAMSGTGKRRRVYFETEKEANKYAASMRTKYHAGERGGIISRQLAQMAGEAAALLEPFGVTILDAAQDMAKRLGSDSNQETVAERFTRAMEENEERLRASTHKAMSKMLDWFPLWFAEMRCAAVTPETTRQALTEGRTVALSTLQTRMRYVSSILNHKERHRKERAIQIMTMEQVSDMIAACGDHSGERMAVALILFAGIRPSVDDGEITRLDWETVGDESIYIPATVSKTHTDRLIPITPILAAMIKGHPKSGTVIPANWRKRIAIIRQKAGITGMSDVARHTFASHFLAAFGEEATKAAMGHTEGSRTLFRHYARAISEEDGLAYFEA